ncbi:MAG: YncE family protein [Bacteroidota bacterium]
MKKLLIIFLLTALSLFSCNENKSIIGTTNPVGSVDKIYGVGFHTKIGVGWEISSASISQFGIYRHFTPLFSFESGVRIGTVLTSSLGGMIDTGLVNGTTYYYTVVPEQKQSDGTFIKGAGSKTIALIPKNLSTVPTDQIVYSQHIQPIFTSGCAIHGCHGGSEHATLLKSLHGGSEFSLTNWNSVMEGTEEIPQIVPYRASRSHIIQHLNMDTLISPIASPSMPQGFSFPTELRDLLIRWINNGAKNDNGTVAHSSMPIRGWAYVTNQGEDLTAVIDLDKNKISRFVTSGVENTAAAPPQAPHNVFVDWQNQYYYVNLIGGSKLLKFRISDNAKVGELTTGLSSPAQIALSKNSDTAYVSNFENAKTNITLVNTATMTKLAEIGSSAMLKPHGISITPNFKYVLVANSLSDNVTVIQTSDNAIVKTIPMSGSVPVLPIGYQYQYEPYQSTITPDNNYAYITCRKSGEVRVIDLVQLKVIDSIKVGTFPLIPAITPNGEYVFVANRNSNSVSAIKTSTRTVEYTVPNVGVEPHGIAVSKDGNFVYVSCENLGVSEPPHHATTGGKKPSFLKVISVAQRAVTASLELGNFGSGMAVTH